METQTYRKGHAHRPMESTRLRPRPPLPFTPVRLSSAARLREGAARSPCALRSAQPHPRVAARDRSDIAARRRARLPWQAVDGARQGICAGQRVVRRPWASRLSRNPTTYRNLLIPRQLLTRLIVLRERHRMVIAAAARPYRRLAARPLTIC